jgi:hypothetical protein
MMAIAGMLSSLGAKHIRVRGPRFKEQSRQLLPKAEFDPAEYAVAYIEDGARALE